jgi:hypothetical protein
MNYPTNTSGRRPDKMTISRHKKLIQSGVMLWLINSNIRGLCALTIKGTLSPMVRTHNPLGQYIIDRINID